MTPFCVHVGEDWVRVNVVSVKWVTVDRIKTDRERKLKCVVSSCSLNIISPEHTQSKKNRMENSQKKEIKVPSNKKKVRGHWKKRAEGWDKDGKLCHEGVQCKRDITRGGRSVLPPSMCPRFLRAKFVGARDNYAPNWKDEPVILPERLSSKFFAMKSRRQRSSGRIGRGGGRV